ncbi:MAG: transposase, partial [Oscillospiraceae bacterium]|nr:transposase [Oscillospiraceae bacterium]
DPPALPVRQAGGRAGGYSPRQYARENRDLDRRLSKLRAPYEGTFSKQNKRVRYRGVAKNQGAEFLYAVAYNFGGCSRFPPHNPRGKSTQMGVKTPE